VGSCPGRVAAGFDDRRGGAKIPGGRDPDSAARTSDSARPIAGAVLPRPLRRSRSPASRVAADHSAAVGVNPDASRFCDAPGSGAPERHAPAAPAGWSDSAGRRHAGCRGAPAVRTLRRSRSGRGRNGRRSAPGCDSPRTQTAGLTGPRYGPIGKPPVDERLDCRNTGSACVPSTAWGTASSETAKFNIGAVLAPRTGKHLLRHPALLTLIPLKIMRDRITPGDARPSTHQTREAVKIPQAPDLRRFRQPSTTRSRRIACLR
jgi:hypothetical protein